ncbi:hypothetical protein GCM10010415_20830 [Streptomyces atrovirens]
MTPLLLTGIERAVRGGRGADTRTPEPRPHRAPGSPARRSPSGRARSATSCGPGPWRGPAGARRTVNPPVQKTGQPDFRPVTDTAMTFSGPEGLNTVVRQPWRNTWLSS